MIKTMFGTKVSYEIDDDFILLSSNAGIYLDRIKSVNLLPFPNLQIYYSDNIWDFSEYRILNIRKDILKFNFNRCIQPYVDELKKYVLYTILKGDNKTQTINILSNSLTKFFNYAFDSGYYHVKDFDSNLITNFVLETNGFSKSYRRQKVGYVRQFFYYYSAHFENIMTVEIENQLDDSLFKLTQKEKENNKILNIPDSFFDAFLKTAIKILNDSEAPTLERATVCMILILSQTGLRISEILDLRCDAICRIVSVAGSDLYYLNYRTWKRENGNNVFSIEQTFANDYVRQAFNVLIVLYHKQRDQINCDYLFLGNSKKAGKTDLPVTANKFRYFYLSAFAYMNQYFQTINLPQDKRSDLSTCILSKRISLKKYSEDAHTLTYPHTSQFRVHVCSELYAMGVPLAYVQKFMGHLSYDMKGYYVRTDPQDRQEDIKYAQDVFDRIVSGRTKLLGKGAGRLTEQINVYVQENGFNILYDMPSVLKLLTNTMPVRQKAGGVCIRSSMSRDCSMDAATDEFFCAYDVCPNIYHFFDMVDFNYQKAKGCWEGILNNRERGFLREAYRESLKLQTLVNEKLLPELEELNIRIHKCGVEKVIKEFPNLDYIAFHIEDVFEEVKIWKEISI